MKAWKGLYICYVNQPSSCEDLKNSGDNPGKQVSAEACKDVNAGKQCFVRVQYIHNTIL